MIFGAKKIHFVGIGGIGVSALARMFLLDGKQVTGSDASESRVTKELKELGAKIFLGHRAENVPNDAELVITTIAVTKQNPELVLAEEKNINILSYPQALGEISKMYQTIAVSGTHGKTTVTAMLSGILEDANIDPTVVVGSLLTKTGSNFRKGNGAYFLVEACESRRSFLNLSPTFLVITNVDIDHLDYYKNLEDIKLAFTEMVNKVPEHGAVIYNALDQNLKDIVKNCKAKLINYTEYINENFNLKVPGQHNRQNAAAALALALALNINKQAAIKSLANFSGTWRRFEFKGKTLSGALIYDDYAHHPTEIMATISAAREAFKNKKITVVFQPHLFSRTKILLEELAKSLSFADEVFLLPIYAARETDDVSISSKVLLDRIALKNSNVSLFESFDLVSEKLQSRSSDEIIITIGAGDISKLSEMLIMKQVKK